VSAIKSTIKKLDRLEGKLFLRPQGIGHPPSWQKGRIDRRLNDDHYLIELYSWDFHAELRRHNAIDNGQPYRGCKLGGSSYMTVASVASMTNWRIYDHNEGHEAWRSDGEKLLEETRPTKEIT